jgi:hypothetical protein
MKPIQFTIEEDLLARLDADQEVQRDGRSAVLRRAVAAYLQTRHAQGIAEAYRSAYAKDDGLGPEFAGWEDQGTWPDA